MRASKIGITICGAKSHEPWPDLKSLERSLLEVPNAPVREMRGKNAARAAPMSALAARSRLSAWRTSGRQEHLGGHAGRNFFRRGNVGQPRWPEFASHRSAQQKVQCILILGHQLSEAGKVSTGGIHLRLRAIKVQVGHEAEIMAALDQIVGLLLGRKSAFRQGQVLSIRGQGEIRVGNRRHQQDLCAATGLLRGQVFL